MKNLFKIIALTFCLCFVSQTEAVAGYRGWFGYNAISLNGAYQVHKDFESVDGLQWYFGGGGGIDFYSYSGLEESNTVIKVSGYLGLQYTFEDTPISVTIDWVPTFGIGDNLLGFNNTGFQGGYGGLGVRYILGR